MASTALLQHFSVGGWSQPEQYACEVCTGYLAIIIDGVPEQICEFAYFPVSLRAQCAPETQRIIKEALIAHLRQALECQVDQLLMGGYTVTPYEEDGDEPRS